MQQKKIHSQKHCLAVKFFLNDKILQDIFFLQILNQHAKKTLINKKYVQSSGFRRLVE